MARPAFPVLLFLFVGWNAATLSAQESVVPSPEDADTTGATFYIIEQVPQFPGGEEALMKYLSENVEYPPKAKDAGIQGRVYVQFVVDTTGYIDPESIEVLRGVHPLLDDEAVRVVRGMPRWTPGYQRGKKVRVYYKMPFNFHLKGSRSKKGFCGNWCF